jgi:hypothetical protein
LDNINMGSWGPGNFDDDGAQDYLDTITAALEKKIEEVLLDKDRANPEEDGESVLMPSVALISVLCEHCQSAPPKEELVRTWHQKYIEIFDIVISGRDPKRCL